MKQYVQHISGQGRKWQIIASNGEHSSEWRVQAQDHIYYHDLPKSEFVLCTPPEEWEDVTAECHVGKATPEVERWSITHKDTNDVTTDIFNKYQYCNYRVTKINHIHNGPAFIIERKKS